MNPASLTQGEIMCAVEEAWSNYSQLCVDVFEVIEQVNPDPAFLDRTFDRARRAQSEWAAIWEGHDEHAA